MQEFESLIFLKKELKSFFTDFVSFLYFLFLYGLKHFALIINVRLKQNFISFVSLINGNER